MRSAQSEVPLRCLSVEGGAVVVPGQDERVVKLISDFRELPGDRHDEPSRAKNELRDSMYCRRSPDRAHRWIEAKGPMGVRLADQSREPAIRSDESVHVRAIVEKPSEETARCRVAVVSAWSAGPNQSRVLEATSPTITQLPWPLGRM